MAFASQTKWRITNFVEQGEWPAALKVYLRDAVRLPDNSTLRPITRILVKSLVANKASMQHIAMLMRQRGVASRLVTPMLVSEMLALSDDKHYQDMGNEFLLRLMSVSTSRKAWEGYNFHPALVGKRAYDYLEKGLWQGCLDVFLRNERHGFSFSTDALTYFLKDSSPVNNGTGLLHLISYMSKNKLEIRELDVPQLYRAFGGDWQRASTFHYQRNSLPNFPTHKPTYFEINSSIVSLRGNWEQSLVKYYGCSENVNVRCSQSVVKTLFYHSQWESCIQFATRTNTDVVDHDNNQTDPFLWHDVFAACHNNKIQHGKMKSKEHMWRNGLGLSRFVASGSLRTMRKWRDHQSRSQPREERTNSMGVVTRLTKFLLHARLEEAKHLLQTIHLPQIGSDRLFLEMCFRYFGKDNKPSQWMQSLRSYLSIPMPNLCEHTIGILSCPSVALQKMLKLRVPYSSRAPYYGVIVHRHLCEGHWMSALNMASECASHQRQLPCDVELGLRVFCRRANIGLSPNPLEVLARIPSDGARPLDYYVLHALHSCSTVKEKEMLLSKLSPEIRKRWKPVTYVFPFKGMNQGTAK